MERISSGVAFRRKIDCKKKREVKEKRNGR